MEENAVIFANGHVVTCDASNRAGKFHVVVRDGRIQEIGGFLDVLKAMYPSASVVDMSGKFLFPGLVNAHFHPESFLLREFTAGKPFNTWAHADAIRTFLEDLFKPHREEHLRTALRATYAAHLKSGTTCVGEYPPPVDAGGLAALQQASDAAPIRVVRVLQNWDQIGIAREGAAPAGRYLVGLGPEEEYTVYSFENFVRAARELDLPVAAHIAEQKDDVDTIRRNFSKSPATLLQDYGALRRSTVLIHLNHGTAEDVQRIVDADAALILSPLSSLHKQCGCPVLRVLARRSPRMSVGTDWGNVDMLSELRFLSDLPKLFGGMPEYSPLQLLRMATIDGAVAVGQEDQIGSIEVGKFADMIAVEMSDLRHSRPEEEWTADRYAQELLRLPGPLTPSDVMVGGKFVVKESTLVTVDEAELLARFANAQQVIVPRAGSRLGSLWAAPQDQAAPKARIYAFASGDRGPERETEGFVSGAVPRPVSGEEGKSRPSTEAPQPDRAVDAKEYQEPPGRVKKVFGEDDTV